MNRVHAGGAAVALEAARRLHGLAVEIGQARTVPLDAVNAGLFFDHRVSSAGQASSAVGSGKQSDMSKGSRGCAHDLRAQLDRFALRLGFSGSALRGARGSPVAREKQGAFVGASGPSDSPMGRRRPLFPTFAPSLPQRWPNPSASERSWNPATLAQQICVRVDEYDVRADEIECSIQCKVESGSGVAARRSPDLVRRACSRGFHDLHPAGRDPAGLPAGAIPA
jgi:hypothetical protein